MFVLPSREQEVIKYLERYTNLLQAVCDTTATKMGIESETVTVTWGTKYYKVIKEGKYQKFVHSFIDRKTGQLFKPASWDGPSKTTNYNIVDDFKKLVKDVDPYGAYLYKKNPLTNR